LREAVRKQLIQHHLRYDFVVVARKAITEAGFAEVYKDASEVFSRIVNEDIDNKLDKVL
jgi:RNase P protein component